MKMTIQKEQKNAIDEDGTNQKREQSKTKGN